MPLPSGPRAPARGLASKWMAPVRPGVPPKVPGPNCAFVQLPQRQPDAGYYNYGTPGNGAGQYGLPETIDLLQQIGQGWTGAKFGVGNISLARGGKFGRHEAHSSGKGIDIRPMRRDGEGRPTKWQSPDYDRAATQRLIDALRASRRVETILFNDPQIRGVVPWKGHDDHFHVKVKSSCPGR